MFVVKLASFPLRYVLSLQYSCFMFSVVRYGCAKEV